MTELENTENEMNLDTGFDIEQFTGIALESVEAFFRTDLPLGSYGLQGKEVEIAGALRDWHNEKNGETLSFLDVAFKHDVVGADENMTYLSSDPETFKQQVDFSTVEDALKSSAYFGERFSICVKVNGVTDNERVQRGLGEIKAFLMLSGFPNPNLSLNDLKVEWPGHVYVGRITGSLREGKNGQDDRVFNRLDMKHVKPYEAPDA